MTSATQDLPLVSLVMVTNRVSPFVEESLQSVVGQTYPRLDIIVVDDGCKDFETLSSILARYPVRVIRQTASGVSVGRNRGALLAEGTIVGFFDDDDRYPPEWVSKHVAHHSEDVNTVLTYANIRSIDASGRLMAEDTLRNTNIDGIYRRDVNILAGSILVRREAFFLAGGFNPLIRHAEDLDFVLRCAHLGSFAYVSDAVRDYRTHDENATRNYRRVATSIRAINAFYRTLMTADKQKNLARALRASDRANDRYALWRAVTSARSHEAESLRRNALTDLSWALRFAPRAPLDALDRRAQSLRITR